MKKRIGIIGSGMAGLAAAWYMGRDHEVTLFERQPRIGIGAHSIDLPGGRVDAPLRVIYPGYYPELFGLLGECGVALEPLDASLSFSPRGGPSYFRYWNTPIFGKTLPMMSPLALMQSTPRQILGDLMRFMRRVPRQLAAGELQGRMLGEFLQAEGYSEAFREKFLIPCFSGINTVSNESVRRYPADVIASYFTRRFLFSRVYRAIGGATAMAMALSQPVAQMVLDARIFAVTRSGNGATVRFEDGSVQDFDAIVFATQANQVLPLLTDASAEERDVLSGFRYETVDVSIHRDPNLMPAQRKDWAPVNYLLDDVADRPLITIWVNPLLPSYQHPDPVFQTVNGHVPVREELMIQQTRLQRPAVALDTAALHGRLNALHAEPGRRIFFCGSYATTGIPLLESATVSALSVARCCQ